MTETTPSEVWASLFRLATTICTQITAEQPDAVVVLQRSGAVVWHAVCTVWAATAQRPLPPTIEILVGQETAATCDEEVLLNEWEYEDPKYVGSVVACVAHQAAWQQVLRARLHAALGDTQPARLLVVDDVVHDGYTAITALGLIWSILPKVDAGLYAGMPEDWRELLGRHWLATFYPAVAAQMAANWEQDKVALFPERADWLRSGFCWPPLISGLARGSAPLSSIPLAAALPYPEYLTRYMAPAQWLEFSAWVYTTVAAEMAARLAAAPAPPEVPVRWRPRRYVLSAVELVWAQAWLREWSTLDQFAEGCRAAAADLEPIVRDLVAEGEFACRIQDGTAQYRRKIQLALVTADAWFGRYWGWLTQEIVEERPVVTPFAVEYARSAPEQAGAPMLIAVGEGQGSPVCGRLLLYGVGNDRIAQPDSILQCCSSAGDAGVTVECFKEFAGVTEVYAIRHTADLECVLDPTVADAEKGRRLAELAAASLTPETMAQGTDGIQYLINALARGVETRLTPYYREALLQMAGGAPDLPTARRRLLAAKGISEPAPPDAVPVQETA